MRDNLVFSGIPESAEEDPEATVKTFIKTYLKLSEDTVENICFERVHRMGAKKPGAPRPRPIVAKFGYFKQKEQVKSRGRELKGTDFSVNDQFPKEILERRKILFPIRRSLIQKGSFLSSFYFHPSLFASLYVFLTSNSFHCTDHLLYYTYTHNTLYHTSARHDHVHIHSALTKPLRPYSAHRHEGHTRIQVRTRPLISYSFEHHTQRAALATHTHLWAH